MYTVPENCVSTGSAYLSSRCLKPNFVIEQLIIQCAAPSVSRRRNKFHPTDLICQASFITEQKTLVHRSRSPPCLESRLYQHASIHLGPCYESLNCAEKTRGGNRKMVGMKNGSHGLRTWFFGSSLPSNALISCTVMEDSVPLIS